MNRWANLFPHLLVIWTERTLKTPKVAIIRRYPKLPKEMTMFLEGPRSTLLYLDLDDGITSIGEF